tara:strand:- start:634 stop:861 length:228 start_codon:yes stop_codon:yes gene_type:complete
MSEYDDGKVIDSNQLLEEAVDFIDTLQKNVQQIAHEDQRDADQVTDGTGDILRGRADLAYDIDYKIQNWKERTLI